MLWTFYHFPDIYTDFSSRNIINVYFRATSMMHSDSLISKTLYLGWKMHDLQGVRSLPTQYYEMGTSTIYVSELWKGTKAKAEASDSYVVRRTGIAWIFRTSWPKMGVLMGNMRNGDAMLTSTNSFLLLGFLRLCQFGWKSIKKCDRESAHRRTDTHTQMQTDFIICPIGEARGCKILATPSLWSVP